MILVVDDEQALLLLIEQLLEGAGYEVTCVASGEEALAVARNEAPEALVTDIDMPEMSGTELAVLLRAQVSDLPVVYITGGLNPRDAQLVPGSIVLEKPLRRAQLIEALSRVIGARGSS